MIKIRLPAQLKMYTEGKDLEVEGETVKEALNAIPHIEIKSRLFKADGSVNRFINVYLNEEDIRFSLGLNTSVKNGDVISLISAIAGG